MPNNPIGPRPAAGEIPKSAFLTSPYTLLVFHYSRCIRENQVKSFHPWIKSQDDCAEIIGVNHISEHNAVEIQSLRNAGNMR